MWSIMLGTCLYWSTAVTSAPLLSEGQSNMTKIQSDPDSVTSYEFGINRVTMCADLPVFLLVVVCSSVQNIELRQAIRDTWAAQLSKQSKLIFLVAMTDDRTLQQSLVNESNNHKDIIQVDFMDSYANLTHKSIAMLKWIHWYCNQAQYVLKSDDDIFINIPLLIKDLTNSIHSHFIMGQLIAGAEPVRDKLSKWYTPDSVYSGKRYPEYISGCAYVISGDLIDSLYSATTLTPFYWIEDVYITAMCAQVAGARHVFNAKFGYRNRDACMSQSVITSHRLTADSMRTLWKEVSIGSGC